MDGSTELLAAVESEESALVAAVQQAKSALVAAVQLYVFTYICIFNGDGPIHYFFFFTKLSHMCDLTHLCV